MTTVTSNDGTTIAYTRIGAGPAVVLVDGALCHRTFGPNESLAEQLAQQFTVYTYDRRGRGDSGDTGPYAVEREFEDLGALVKEAGGSAHVRISSGGALALAAANAGLPVDRLAVFEVPFVTDHSRPPIPVDLKDRTRELVAAGKRGGAVAAFMREGVNLPAPVVAMMRLMPAWRGLKRLAHAAVRPDAAGRRHRLRRPAAAAALGADHRTDPGHRRRQEPAADAERDAGSDRRGTGRAAPHPRGPDPHRQGRRAGARPHGVLHGLT